MMGFVSAGLSRAPGYMYIIYISVSRIPSIRVCVRVIHLGAARRVHAKQRGEIIFQNQDSGGGGAVGVAGG